MTDGEFEAGDKVKVVRLYAKSWEFQQKLDALKAREPLVVMSVRTTKRFPEYELDREYIQPSDV